MSKKWRSYYHFMMHYRSRDTGRKIIWGAVHPATYGWMWALVAGSIITAMVLFTTNYSTCNNNFYVAVTALTLFAITALSMWGPLFIKMRNPGAGLGVTLAAWAAQIIALVFIILATVNDTASCSADKAPGIAACVLYGWPILWVTYAAFIQLQFLYIDPQFRYKTWLRNRKTWMDTLAEQQRGMYTDPYADMKSNDGYGYYRGNNDRMYMMSNDIDEKDDASIVSNAVPLEQHVAPSVAIANSAANKMAIFKKSMLTSSNKTQ